MEPLLTVAFLARMPMAAFHGDRLAGAGLAHQRHRLALVQVDVHAADGVDRAAVVLKGDIKVSHRQDLFFLYFRHGVFLPYILFILGSSASRRPSASRLKLSISRLMTTMGGMI